VLIIGLSGCLSWDQGWKRVKDTARKGDASGLITKANHQITDADTKEKVAELIQTYEQVLEIDPENYEALWSLGRYYVLMGVAYSENNEMKKEYSLKAMRVCERGMYTNPEFKKLVDDGATVWEASSALNLREIEAMDYWYTALGWYLSDCMNQAERILNIRWFARGQMIVDRMMAIDPAWGGGHPYACKAAYYAAAPSFMGGDLHKSAEYFAKADEAGAGWLYVKFSRAKFLHTKTGDREAFRKDLEWILAQDPHKALSPYPWNVYFQREAKRLLDQVQ
jgi:tetratricopeptide (TPR) repeat protein